MNSIILIILTMIANSDANCIINKKNRNKIWIINVHFKKNNPLKSEHLFFDELAWELEGFLFYKSFNLKVNKNNLT